MSINQNEALSWQRPDAADARRQSIPRITIDRRERASILGYLGLNVALPCSPEMLFNKRIPGHRYILCNSKKL